MAQVHNFPLITDLYDDTRLPLQYLGNSLSPVASQVELSVLLQWIVDNLTASDIATALASLPSYDNDDAAVSALGSGKLYWGSAAHDRLAGALFKTP